CVWLHPSSEKCRGLAAVHWRLDIEIKLTNRPQESNAAVAFDLHFWSGSDHALVIGEGEPVFDQRFTGFFLAIKRLAGCLQDAKLVPLKCIIGGDLFPPRFCCRRQVLWRWLRFTLSAQAVVRGCLRVSRDDRQLSGGFSAALFHGGQLTKGPRGERRINEPRTVCPSSEYQRHKMTVLVPVL